MPQIQAGQVTELLRLWKRGDGTALEQILPLVYQELRRLAHSQLRAERVNHTIQSTALVHEAYLKLVGSHPADLRDRAHFIAVASRAMRQILVDLARGRDADKRNAGLKIDFEELPSLPVRRDEELLALDDALSDLARIDQRQAQGVEMRFWRPVLASEVLGVSRATAAIAGRR